MHKIPFVDLYKQYQEIKPEIDQAIREVIDSSEFILGKECELFEREFAKFCGVKYGVGVNSGLSALELGLRVLEIGQGDEVIVPVNSYIGSAMAVSVTGAKPVLVDCREDTFNIDTKKAEEAITSKTRAIMPVHLYGQIADMESILGLAKKHNLLVIEDAAQAHGASFKRSLAGSFGALAAFSFYPGKNLGAYGDGGIVVTNKKTVAEKLKIMRNHGQTKKYHHVMLGWNNRLDNLQAAVLRVKLRKLAYWNAQRFTNAKLYNKYLARLPVITPRIFQYYGHIFHLYVIRTQRRNKLARYLLSRGITTNLHYPIPIHLQPAYKDLGYKRGSFPVTENLSKEILSLPMFPQLKESEIRYICKNIAEFYSGTY